MQHQPPTDLTATLRRALAFYADVKVYKPPYAGGEGQIMQDCGQIARKALEDAEMEGVE